ncbi:uncharacterized protein LOC131229248 [Magnolia sinica]|uniref:uncharacterized protein LOC131229248 n=1 Tax=Magnolia sinica TaxID=86752 RepID=UPI00265AC8C2|nr:uncharacterized protein LOC131229248 [Magnolia sinica]
MKSTTSSPNIFIRCIKAPIRVLSKARDFYVESLTNCAGRAHYGGGARSLPKSFSVSSSRASEDEDIRALMRALSQKSQGETPVGSFGSKGLPKSFSVAISRIDEDEPCDFKDDIKVNSDLLYPRSRSYAVTNRRTGMLS